MDARGHGDSEEGWRDLSVDEGFEHFRWARMANDFVAAGPLYTFPCSPFQVQLNLSIFALSGCCVRHLEYARGANWLEMVEMAQKG